jgi:hypothetical protein
MPAMPRKPAIAIVDPHYPTWNASSHTLKMMFGLGRTAQLPPEGMAPRTIQGIDVYVKPLPPKTGRFRNFSIRVTAVCPLCGRHVAASRLPQHTSAHEPAAVEAFNAARDVANINGETV